MAATLSDLETAPIGEPLKATLRMLRKQCLEHKLDESAIRAVLAAGVSPAQIEDALAVSFVFNVMDRLAESFAFHIPPDRSFEIGARFLLARGYR